MSARILAVDVESSPMMLWGYGLRNQFFAPKQIERHSEIIGWAWMWVGKGEKTCVWRRADDPANWDELWNRLDEATHVLHFNGQRFDIPFINTEIKRLDVHGGRPPSPFKHVDLYRQIRSVFKLASYKLEYTSTFLCKLEGKLDENALDLWLEIWRAQRRGDEKAEARAWARMARYCKRDVTIMPKMLDDLRPWLKGLNLNLYATDPTEDKCPNCGGYNLQRRGFEMKTAGRYQRYQCQDCGKWSYSRNSQGFTNIRST